MKNEEQPPTPQPASSGSMKPPQPPGNIAIGKDFGDDEPGKPRGRHPKKDTVTIILPPKEVAVTSDYVTIRATKGISDMAHPDHNRNSRGHFPFDIGALLAPTLCFIFLGVVSTYLSRFRSPGDRTLLTLALLLGGIGVVLLFLARLPFYRQRHFFILGSRHLSGVHKRLYYVAYGFLIPCILLLLTLTLF